MKHAGVIVVQANHRWVACVAAGHDRNFALLVSGGVHCVVGVWDAVDIDCRTQSEACRSVASLVTQPLALATTVLFVHGTIQLSHYQDWRRHSELRVPP